MVQRLVSVICCDQIHVHMRLLRYSYPRARDRLVEGCAACDSAVATSKGAMSRGFGVGVGARDGARSEQASAPVSVTIGSRTSAPPNGADAAPDDADPCDKICVA